MDGTRLPTPPPTKRFWGFRLDSRSWREDLLAILLRVALTLGVLVYIFSVYWAWERAMWGIIAVDTFVLGAMAAIWWFDQFSYRARALAVCTAVYLLGTMLLTVAGMVGQIYLLGHTALVTFLLGQRAGIISVIINSLTLLILGIAGAILWETPPAGWSGEIIDTFLLLANFLLVANIIALVVGGVVDTLERAVEREVSTQAALIDRKQRLEALIDASPNGILVLSASGILMEVNPLGRSLLECDDADNLLHRSFDEFVSPEHRQLFKQHHEKVCGGDNGSFECDLIGLHQRKVNVEFVSAPLAIGDSPTQHLAVVRDITKQREMTEQLRRAQHLDAVGKLTGGIAHDFNNVLTIILGGADELATQLKDDPVLREDADAILEAAVRGAELTQRLLAFSRQQALDPRPTHIGELLHKMASLLRRTLGENVELLVQIDETSGCVARVDPSQLENAVLNLCLNSRDAMPNGGLLTLEVGTANVDASEALLFTELNPGRYVTIAVTDTGEGMSPAVVAQAFEPFFTTKETNKGTGLGLSMVYGFVKQSGGHVKIYSEPGHGSTIRIYLPTVAGEPAEAVPRGHGAGDIEGGSEHILVVEDNPAVLAQVLRHLQQLGYQMATATNGPDALVLLQSGNRFDLLFTDVVMPGGMNGLELAAAATKLQPDLPVLLTSGYTQTAVLREGTLPSGTSLLNKPYRRVDLALKLRQMLT